ncbi:uncharacterized protein LOC131605185 [Vicia villosa]|uniref:uncharacterized protein LOC131605185 n=1 Tax=Vicia villosa TaxID=3911 RepID=UPI00273B8477|nr:uncharacterized protein LOC131605185 [Vicia villosa]
MAQAMQNQPNADENAGSRSLATFQRENPPVFKGTHDPDGALDWLKEIERIFRVMDCTPTQKVRYGTHMLAKEADDWWLETRRRLEAHEIKKAVSYQKIRIFVDLVDSCRIYEEDNNAHYRVINEKRGKNQQSREKPYDAGKGKQRRCYRCGKTGHMSSACKHKDVVCFNCGVEGHIDSQCQKPKKTAVGGKVFALSGTQTSSEDGLVRDWVLLCLL